MSKSAYKKWVIHEGGVFFPSHETTNRLPAGVYEIRNSMKQGMFLKAQNVITEGIIDIPMPEMKNILTDIKAFWEKEELYKLSKMVYKRGILLFGCPGSGKSVVIQRLIKHIIQEKQGIVINLSSCTCVENYITFCPEILRAIEPNRPMLVVIEEIDELIYRGHTDIPAMLLNMLDGIRQVSSVVYVASTNHPERLDQHFANRPGRFDLKRKIGLPNKESREYFIRHKLSPEELKKINLSKWLEDSEGFSIAHLKEMICSVVIMGKDYVKVVESLKRMKDFKSSREDTGSEIGY